MVAELRKRKEKAAPATEPVAKKATKKTEKRKADEESSPVAVKKQKSVSLKEKPKAVKATPTKSPKASKKTKKVVEEEQVEENETEIQIDDKAEEDVWSGIEEGDDVDDQTKALVETFDSGDEAKDVNAGTYKKGQEVGKAPKAAGKVKKVADPMKSNPANRGTIYVGHIPFGFFEHQMKEYFSQFGDVTRIRLSRNKKTGNYKHYGFVEFADAEVASIVAKTMDKYLLFGCILAVRVVPAEQIHPDLWKGANRRWKHFDRNAAERKQLAARAGETQWNERVAKEEDRRAKRAEKLRELGYEFEAPKLKAAVAPETPLAIENGDEAAPKEIEAAAEPKSEEAPVEEEEKVVAKKGKPAKKGTKAKKVKS